MIGIGIKDRKKTAWPTGTSLVASLIMPAITTNKSTAVIFRHIAKTGRWLVCGLSMPLAALFNARVQGEIIFRDGKLVVFEGLNLTNLSLIFANLPTVHEDVIQDDTCHHRLANRHSADANAWIMTPFGDDIGFFT